MWRIMPEPEQALRHCSTLLSPVGRIYFTQTIQMQPARWMEVLKPMLKRITSIDFGRITYENEFKAQIRAAGLELEELTTLARHGSRASCIAVARRAAKRPRAGAVRELGIQLSSLAKKLRISIPAVRSSVTSGGKTVEKNGCLLLKN